MRINTTHTGLTLIEVVVYVAGMVMVVGAITYSIMETYRVYTVLAYETRIDRVGLTVIDSLGREVRSGISIDQNGTDFGVSEGSLTLEALRGEDVVTKYIGLEGGRIVYEEDGGETAHLNPEDVVVSRLTFTEVSNSISEGVRFEVDLTYTRKGQERTETYSGFAILRHSYE